MHLAVPNLTEQDCVVLDSTAVSCSGLEGTGRDGTGLSCYGLYCSALHLTGLDSTAVDLYRPGLCWIEMNSAGREWIGIGWDGTGLDGRRFHWMDWTARRWEWSGLDWAGQHCRRLKWTALHFTGPDCLRLTSTSPDCTTLDWTGKYHTGQSLYLARLICTRFFLSANPPILHKFWWKSAENKLISSCRKLESLKIWNDAVSRRSLIYISICLHIYLSPY